MKTRRGFIPRYFNDVEAGFNLSWASVFAGLVTFIAIFMLLSLIGSAIGFGMVEATESDPLSGVGTGLMIWTVITMLISLFCAGMVAGMTARRAGFIHGFLTWAVSLIVLAYFVTSAIMGVFGVLGSMISGVAKGAGTVVGGIGEAAASAISSGVEYAADEIGGVNTDELDKEIRSVLRDTEVKELQPAYIEKELEKSKDDVLRTAKSILTNPSTAGEKLENLANKLAERAEKIGENVDKDAISKAVAKNSDLTESEAKKATENIYNGLQNATTEAKEQMENLKSNIESAKADVEQAIEDARVAADEAASKASLASVLLFIGLLIGMILTAFAGYMGSKTMRKYFVLEK